MLFNWCLFVLVLSSCCGDYKFSSPLVADALAFPLMFSSIHTTSPPFLAGNPAEGHVSAPLGRNDLFYQAQRPHEVLSMKQLTTWIQDSIAVPPAGAAEVPSSSPPTKEEIALLREAFASFYGTTRDYTTAERLLTEAIEAWQRQPPDEQAGLYRVRGDCEMALLQPERAIADYSKALDLLRITTKADPAELPAT